MPGLLELFEELVARRSTSDRATASLANWVIRQSAAEPSEVTLQTYESDRKANLLIQRGGSSVRGAGLVLCGHLDVVPADEPGWETDPWTLTDGGDRWVGRGSCDMKGFLALAIDRFRAIETRSLRAPLALLFTSDEEIGSLGAQRWRTMGTTDRADAERGLPRQILIGEPTELRAIRMHKGHLRLNVEIAGVGAHSGFPHRGRSAIVPAAAAIAALTELGSELATETSDFAPQFPEVPFVVLNIGRIEGGTAVNVVPDRCRLELGVRLLPDTESARIIERIESTLAAALGDVDWRLEIVNESPPLRTAIDAPLYAALRKALDQTHDPGASFSSDGGTLARDGFDCVLFGPGSIEVAHKPNEFVPKSELARAGQVLDDLIEHFCGARPG